MVQWTTCSRGSRLFHSVLFASPSLHPGRDWPQGPDSHSRPYSRACRSMQTDAGRRRSVLPIVWLEADFRPGCPPGMSPIAVEPIGDRYSRATTAGRFGVSEGRLARPSRQPSARSGAGLGYAPSSRGNQRRGQLGVRFVWSGIPHPHTSARVDGRSLSWNVLAAWTGYRPSI